ncbi:MAG: acyl-CoA carboxylase biotin carboxyl carrier protein subunit [Planctomycetota bacterium]|jgi:biotin carboxyl carrier protein
MASFQFRLFGRKREVACERQGNRLRIRIDGEEEIILPEFIHRHLLNLKTAERTFPVWIARAPGALFIAVEGETYRIEFDNGEEETACELEDAVLEPGSHTLKVPMPGTVAKVLVGEGDRVGGNQPLVIVEAMKMENSVRAPVPCRVGRIHVIEGDVVNLGDPLLEMIIPAPAPTL